MVRSFCLFVVAFFAVSIGFAQNINGKWKGQMQSPNGPMDLVFDFKANGDSLSGTVQSPMGNCRSAMAKLAATRFFSR